MKAVLLFAVTAVTLGLAAGANAATWKPGTPVHVSEKEMIGALEKKFDFAYCDGIPRFGHRGGFPYEKFIVFDCSVKINGVYCADARLKALRAERRDSFKVKLLRECT